MHNTSDISGSPAHMAAVPGGRRSQNDVNIGREGVGPLKNDVNIGRGGVGPLKNDVNIGRGGVGPPKKRCEHRSRRGRTLPDDVNVYPCGQSMAGSITHVRSFESLLQSTVRGCVREVNSNARLLTNVLAIQF